METYFIVELKEIIGDASQGSRKVLSSDGQPDQVFYDKAKNFTNGIIKNNRRQIVQDGMKSWPAEESYTRKLDTTSGWMFSWGSSRKTYISIYLKMDLSPDQQKAHKQKDG